MDVISMRDFTKEQILAVLDAAEDVKKAIHESHADFEKKYGKNITELLQESSVFVGFFEKSTRTNYSFRTAARKTGASVEGFSSPDDTSLKKGESFSATFTMIADYGYNAIVMRSTEEGLPRWIKETLEMNQEHLASQSAQLKIPYSYQTPMILNGGDGRNQHPTQCFLDLFTMRELAKANGKELEGLEVALLNDLANGRTIASLISVAPLFGWKLHMAYPDRFGPRQFQLDDLAAQEVEVIDYGENFLEALSNAFIAYQSRPQKERVGKGEDFARIKKVGQITGEMYDQLGNNGPWLMHPLPVDDVEFEEIHYSMKNHPKNVTSLQASNALYVRIALLALGLEKMASKVDLSPKLHHSIKLTLEDFEIDSTKLPEPFMRSGYIEEKGVVIDHIPLGYGRRLYGILGFEGSGFPINSSDCEPEIKGGEPIKDIIKIHMPYTLSNQQLTAVAMIAPEAKINLIEDGRVKRKFKPHLGSEISGLVRCINSECITNVEHEHVTPRYSVLPNGTTLRCHYCETPETIDSVYQRQGFIYLK
jgi:aspartate carbamoyltransferase/aspartate carbamoyltransferase regulatory subunit